ncbi:MAG TPA: patatin-like phospholipase family protein [Thermohalobaculum sp.]|nr:patatin-like phospholipase family protein [Thermohalobaculum sp.]
MTVAIALGGGAPNLTLMTGALLALDEAGVEPQVVTTTGAGMVAGLLYAAPRREGPDETWQQARRRALASTREMGIDDLIYDQFPVNYKIFQKPGKLAEAYAHVVNPVVWSIPRETRRQRLLGDAMGFMAAMMQPASLSAASKGLCQPPPWIDLMVDFGDLKRNMAAAKRKFRLTAYCIEDGDERTFDESEITAEHFKAALAMPFIYAPYKMKDDRDGKMKSWLEASAFRTMELNPGDVMTENKIKTLIYFDLMGNDNLIGEPKNLIDAWGKSIVAPLTQIAQQQLAAAEVKLGAVTLLDRYATMIEDLQGITWDIKEALDEAKLKGLDDAGHELVKKLDEMIDGKRAKMNQQFDERVSEVIGKLDGDSTLAKRMKRRLEKRQEVMARHLATITDDREADEYAEKAEERMYKAGENQIYKAIFKAGREELSALPKMLRMPFRDLIPEEHWPKVLDWSHSNMSTLFDIGYETGQNFVEKHAGALGIGRKGRGRARSALAR